jgi:hypothetical protein
MTRKLVTLLFSVMTAIPLMGASSCQQPVQPARALKKKIVLGHIGASAFTLPGGGTFDFESAMNTQVYDALRQVDGFVFDAPSPTVTSAEGTFLSLSPYSEKDQRLLMEAYGATTGNGFVTFATLNDPPACEIDIPQARFDGHVNGFEFASSIGVTFGYNPTGDYRGVSGTISVHVTTAQMDLVMFGSDPLSKTQIASSDVQSNQSKTNVDATINFQDFSLGPKFYFETPLAKVSEKALEKAVTDIKSQTDQLKWVGRVLKNDGKRILINAGARANLKVGDRFDIYNVEHVWVGTPCGQDAVYKGEVPGQQAVATIQISSLGDDISYGDVVGNSITPAVSGARVLINQLAP